MIGGMAEDRPKGGRQHAFNDVEKEALRESLEKYKQLNDLTGAALGEILGVGQQQASDYLRGARMGRPAALRFVKRFGGYNSVEDFLAEEHNIIEGERIERPRVKRVKGRTSATGTSDQGEMAVASHPEREDAANRVRHLGVTDRAIENVIARFHNEPRHESMWWASKFISEQEFLNEQTRQRASREAERAAKKGRKKRGDEEP